MFQSSLIIIFTKSRCDMDNSCSIGSCNKITFDNIKCLFVYWDKIKKSFILFVNEITTLEPVDNFI